LAGESFFIKWSSVMKTRISKAYRGQKHVGWKKTVGGREWYLGSGTSPSHEARAIRLAQALEARWQLAKIAGASELSETDFIEARDLVEGRQHGLVISLAPLSSVAVKIDRPAPPSPQPATTATSQPALVTNPQRRWLLAALDEFVTYFMLTLKPDMSNGDHVVNTRDRIARARDAIQDMPLDSISRKEIDSWLLSIRNLKSKVNGQPLGASTVRNLVGAVRMAFTTFVEWQWWTPPPLWERAFKNFTIKKLQTTAERKKSKRRPPAHTINEKRFLWHTALPFTKAMMAMADWAGHTQKEIATLTFDEIKDQAGEMYIERDRNKTDVHRRWWIPPEAAEFIRRIVAKTPRDPAINPDELAFLTPNHQPLVYRSKSGRFARIDYVGPDWDTLLRAAKLCGVRHISFKFMRKGTSQLIRDLTNKEVSRMFLAHSDEDVQDVNYTRGSVEKVEDAVRQLYPKLRKMFVPLKPGEWRDLSDQITRENGLVNPPEQAAA
jgi:hypothetical protein